MGQIRTFALAKSHASFTLTIRHPRRQSARLIVKVTQQCDRAGKERTVAARDFFGNRFGEISHGGGPDDSKIGKVPE
jgi:hypothetical protein